MFVSEPDMYTYADRKCSQKRMYPRHETKLGYAYA